jgi:hypothetical protein
MNHYRVRVRFKCSTASISSFSISSCSYLDAEDSVQAIKKSLAKFCYDKELPITATLVFISAFFVRKADT